MYNNNKKCHITEDVTIDMTWFLERWSSILELPLALKIIIIDMNGERERERERERGSVQLQCYNVYMSVT